MTDDIAVFSLHEDSARECLGEILRGLRRARRLNQREMAQEMDLSQSALARLECGTSDLAWSRVVGLLRGAGLMVQVTGPWTQFLGGAHGGPSDYLDGQGRRLPAHCDVRPMRVPHQWWFDRAPDISRRYWPEYSFVARSTAGSRGGEPVAGGHPESEVAGGEGAQQGIGHG